MHHFFLNLGRLRPLSQKNDLEKNKMLPDEKSYDGLGTQRQSNHAKKNGLFFFFFFPTILARPSEKFSDGKTAVISIVAYVLTHFHVYIAAVGVME